MRWFFGLIALYVGVTTSAPGRVAADGNTDLPAPDAWHQVAHNSPFFTPETAELRIVAVVQSDGRFARIILGEGSRGAYVTVNLPGTDAATTLRSDLVYSNGGIMTRTIQGDALDVQNMTSSQSVTYSFAIAREDIRAFRGATTWRLTPQDGTPIEITLKGSASAIRRALSDPRPLPGPDTTPFRGEQADALLALPLGNVGAQVSGRPVSASQ